MENKVSTTEAGYKRRELLSNPSLQLRVIISFGLLAIASAWTNFYVGTTAFDSVMDELWSLDMPHSTQRDFQILLEDRRDTLEVQLRIFTFVAVVTVMLAAVFISHHIGGPLTQLNTYLLRMVKGEGAARPITFRSGDFLGTMSDNFNDFQRKFGILKDEDPPPDDTP